MAFTSVRVQQLMDEKLFPDEEFENQKKKEIYEEAKYYHKAQHGLERNHLRQTPCLHRDHRNVQGRKIKCRNLKHSETIGICGLDI